LGYKVVECEVCGTSVMVYSKAKCPSCGETLEKNKV